MPLRGERRAVIQQYYAAIDPICVQLTGRTVFDVLPVSIRALCYTIDDPHVDPAGAPSAPKDDAMACMASSINTPLSPVIPFLTRLCIQLVFMVIVSVLQYTR